MTNASTFTSLHHPRNTTFEKRCTAVEELRREEKTRRKGKRKKKDTRQRRQSSMISYKEVTGGGKERGESPNGVNGEEEQRAGWSCGFQFIKRDAWSSPLQIYKGHNKTQPNLKIKSKCCFHK
ncbi:hypothetical protein V6Z11_A07G136100 [Gossypium hirsutum]